eukprot:1089498-Ditylum_brightwellii.AAC.1
MVRKRDRVQTDGTVIFNGDDDDADEDDTVGNSDDGGANDSADGAEKHLAEIIEQNKISDVGGEDDSVGY